jgi:hypothetical protein
MKRGRMGLYCSKITEPMGIYLERHDKSKYDKVTITLKVAEEPSYEPEHIEKTVYLEEMSEEQIWMLNMWEQLNGKILESFGVKPFKTCDMKSDEKLV